jgi:hypothetical protein
VKKYLAPLVAFLLAFLVSVIAVNIAGAEGPQAPVSYPSAEVEFVVGPQVRSGSEPLAAWYDEEAKRAALYWADYFLTNPLHAESNHYDLVLCLYQLHYRTGDPEYQRLARLVADRWWKGPHLREGLPVEGGSIPAPRSVGFLGLMLYAMDGHPEVFGHLDRITREWVDVRLLGKLSAPEIYTDIREEGYIQLSAVTLARVLPDSYPQTTWGNDLVPVTRTVTDGAARRAKYLADAELVAVNYFGRLQNPDGAWLSNMWVEPYLRGYEQPFMVGVYLEAAVALHGLTANPVVKEGLRTQIVRAVEHLYRDCYVVEQTEGLTTIPRATLYFYPRELVQDPSASDRHLTTALIHAFGYAYKITGDVKFKEWGDELWDSCFAVVPRDGFRSGLDQRYHLKLFTMEARSSGRYLAWRLGGTNVPSPTPTPPPSPTPEPTPTPTPSPEPTPELRPTPACPKGWRKKGWC